MFEETVLVCIWWSVRTSQSTFEKRLERTERENHVQGAVRSSPGRDIPQEGGVSDMFKEQQTDQCRGRKGKNSKS